MVDSRGTSFADAEIERITGASDKPLSSDRMRPSREGAPPCSASERLVPRPDLAGQRIVLPGYADIHLVDPEGYRRRIPNHTTYNRLFRSWDGICDEPGLARIAVRHDFTLGTVLVRGDASGRIYLLDHGMKRLIVTHSVMEKYWFSWSLIHVVQQSLIDRIHSGAEWT